MGNRRALLWFRQDLRVHDNEALIEALNMQVDVVPVYVFDERVFGGKTMFGFDKTGIHRAQFVIESIRDLRASLEGLGSKLIVRIGKPEEVLFDLANQYKTSWVYCNRERTTEEKYVQDTLERRLWSIGQEIRYSRGKMLYYTSDLLFPITHTPDSFSTFKKEVEKIVPVREPLAVPSMANTFPRIKIEEGDVPSIENFGLSENANFKNQVIRGGEREGLIHLEQFLSDEAKNKKGQTVYNEPTMHFNSLLSSYLSQGCLSPKRVYSETLKAVRGNKKAPIFQQIFQRLMYRDYLRLMGKKYGHSIFQKGGVLQAEAHHPQEVSESFANWRKGNTGLELIDAIIHQLNNTGFCSHRARKLVATYLVKDMELHWRWGASWFESQLIDYDPCSNWVNWMNIAGFGPDQKEDRKVNYELQTKRLDPEGSYIRQWA